MTIEQAWQIITDCTLKGDWVGVLVGADALDECGATEEAAGVRWAVRRHLFPIKTDNGNWLMTFTNGTDSVELSGSTHITHRYFQYVENGWKWLVAFRSAILEHLQ